jgi:predicted RNA-binding protein YlxR (DUF448 family)
MSGEATVVIAVHRGDAIATTAEAIAIEVARSARHTSAAAAVTSGTRTTMNRGLRTMMMAKAVKQQGRRPKHIPMRTCVACKETKPKRELLRVVRTPDGHILLDATGKKSGRGAYLCARLSCWETALKKKRLEQEFEVTISDEDRAGLDAFVATLPRD